MNISYYFILFIIYSMIGWIVEVINSLISRKRFVNRGFLIGPYCPIYGVGSVLVIVLLTKYLDEPITLLVMSIVICSLIEYFGSLIMEKLFNTRWWDYSNQKFNINGRICLETMVPFGIGCMAIMYVINPFISKLVLSIPTNILNMIAIILGIIFITDFIVSFTVIAKFKALPEELKKDNTEKVTEYVKKEIIKKNKKLYKRLIDAFPRLTIMQKIKKREQNKNILD